LRAALTASRPPAKHVLVDAGSVNFIDTGACDTVIRFIKELESQGITIAFARVRDEVRERMRLAGIEALVGPTNFYEGGWMGLISSRSSNGWSRTLWR
jgi:MFS superfamily sulfate permease-like transporter